MINSAVVIGLVCYSGAMCALDGGCRPAAARLVHFLVSQRALDAHRGDLLHHLLPDRAADRVPAHRAEEPQAARSARRSWSSSSSCTS